MRDRSCYFAHLVKSSFTRQRPFYLNIGQFGLSTYFSSTDSFIHPLLRSQPGKIFSASLFVFTQNDDGDRADDGDDDDVDRVLPFCCCRSEGAEKQWLHTGQVEMMMIMVMMIADDDVFSEKEEDEFAYRRPLAQNHYFAGPFLLLHWFSTNMVNH